MKKIFLLMILSAYAFNTFSQQTAKPTGTKEYYLEKSSNQKKAGWILLGAGTAAAVVGVIGFNETFNIFSSSSGSDIYGIIFLAGVAADLASIPFFISAGKYKRLAAEVAIDHQSIYLLKGNSIALRPVPALKIKINF